MNITEQMVCPDCIGKTHMPQTSYMVFKNRWYTVDTVKFKKSHRDEYILVLGNNWNRTWVMVDNPEETSTIEATYVEHSVNTELFGKSRTLKPGELCNPSSIYKGYLDIVSEGTTEIKHVMSDRVECIHLHPTSGSLPEINITQKSPANVEYVISHTGKYKFSLHQHEWERGTHYDLRVQMRTNIDEWAIPVNLHNPIPEPVVAIRKNCDDSKWMTFEGEHIINGEKIKATLLDSGMVDISNMSVDSISMSIHGAVVRGNYTFVKDGELWTVTGGDSS